MSTRGTTPSRFSLSSLLFSLFSSLLFSSLLGSFDWFFCLDYRDGLRASDLNSSTQSLTVILPALLDRVVHDQEDQPVATSAVKVTEEKSTTKKLFSSTASIFRRHSPLLLLLLSIGLMLSVVFLLLINDQRLQWRRHFLENEKLLVEQRWRWNISERKLELYRNQQKRSQVRIDALSTLQRTHSEEMEKWTRQLKELEEQQSKWNEHCSVRNDLFSQSSNGIINHSISKSFDGPLISSV